MTVPGWKAERYLLGELPKGEMATLKAMENKNVQFCQQLQELKHSNEDLLARYPYIEMEAEQAPRFKWQIPLSACAALLICVTTFLAVSSNRNIVMNEEGTRVKGIKTDLEIWRKTGDSAEKLTNYSEAKAGDLLQMRYIAEKKCYGAILSIDGNDTLTIHLSGKNGKAAELEAGKIVSLEKGYELDNAPKYETFYLFTAENEFELSQVAENLLNGKLPKNLQATQITLKKK
ncbi:MAG: hypothetical protein LBC75_11565 [Fibromonadaceae bacterium]|jgi:hypothetical protein|nr:hypothetical protein [Fibromonadaceae bacterium]